MIISLGGTVSPVAIYNMYIHNEYNGSLTSHMTQNTLISSPLSGAKYAQRTLDAHRGLTGSYDKADRFVDLSVNLASIGSPSHYFLNFYLAKEVPNTHRNLILDRTLSDAVPPYPCELDCVVVKMPSLATVTAGGAPVMVPVIIKPGNATRFLHDNAIYDRQIYKVSLASSRFGLILKSAPVTVPFAPEQQNISEMFISASNNLQNRNYSLPINETFTTTTAPSQVIGSSNRLNLEIVEPPSVSQNIRNYLTSNVLVAILIPIIITSGAVLVIFKAVDIRKSSILMNLTVGDVIQVDGTVIVGVLILLTLSSNQFTSGGLHRTSLVVGVVTASIVYPFALSVIRMATKGTLDHGIKLTIAGFVYLMVAVMILSFIQ
jgi:hypothetical protein